MNELRRFLIDSAQCRGDWVRADESWRKMSALSNFPAEVQRFVGEATAAALLLSSNLKTGGKLTLQIKSSGPIELLVVQADAHGVYRATAKYSAEPAAKSTLAQAFGEGQFLLSLQLPGAKEDYQALVALSDIDFSTALENYFSQSEQLATRVHLAASKDGVGGMLVQRLPDTAEASQQDWQRIEALHSTLNPQELLNDDAGTLLHKLFHEEAVILYEPRALDFRCNCSRERVSTMIQGLGQDDAKALLAEKGSIEIDCEFCKAHYAFDAQSVNKVFKY